LNLAKNKLSFVPSDLVSNEQHTQWYSLLTITHLILSCDCMIVCLCFRTHFQSWHIWMYLPMIWCSFQSLSCMDFKA
jgi:predicted membrane channel-forming protein YqfA (hemolysin III family)